MEIQDTAIVLHVRRYRENSRIVELFSQEHGRFSGVVRVPKKGGAARAGEYQPFKELFLSWSGNGELKTLRKTEVLDYWPLDGQASICGLYLNELLLYLVEKGLEMPELYQAYRSALSGLKEGEAVPATLRAFEKHLLWDLGYLPSLLDDVLTGESLDSSRPIYFAPGRGVTHERLPESFTVSLESLIALEQEDWHRQSSTKEIRMMLFASIRFLLNGKPLRSRELIQSLNQKPS